MCYFSIIICTYNPNVDIFKRLLLAVSNFSPSSPDHEVIIVDNNSAKPVGALDFVKDFLTKSINRKLIIEKEPGLTNARIAGINQSLREWIVFFDDDNEPFEDYLIKVAESISNYPKVGAWGPGKITVEYTDNKNSWLNKQKTLFQEKDFATTTFDNKKEWVSCYPFGTGLTIRRDVAVEYLNRVSIGRYTLSDRKGKSLSSGGDVQMVLTAIEKGYFSGVVSGLKLTHMIDAHKANLNYIKKQQYWTATSSIIAINQVFNKNQHSLINKVTNKIIFLRIYSLYRIYCKNMSGKDFKILLASKLGELNASVCASGQPKPVLLYLSERVLDV